MRRACAAVAAAACALPAAGCGSSSGDLLAIAVSGGPGNARERIRVTDDGRASCGGALRQLQSQQLLDAREIKRKLKPYAKSGESFRSARAGARQYLARSVDGSVSWTEGAPGPAALGAATLFALRLERELCRGGGSGTTYG
ncbi:MAG: hypothetical protein QOD53_1114 [Thermoleophilaceae bacterium]|nr:hypothetical protein [Thermoleophilaceae bacterium]